MTALGPYDTGSQISFLNKNLVREHLPGAAPRIEPYLVTVVGVGGKRVPILGQIHLECEVAGRVMMQRFIVACICEPVLLGMDFIRQHRAVWDWSLGTLRYQDDEVAESGLRSGVIPADRAQLCGLAEAVDVLPGTVVC